MGKQNKKRTLLFTAGGITGVIMCACATCLIVFVFALNPKTRASVQATQTARDVARATAFVSTDNSDTTSTPKPPNEAETTTTVESANTPVAPTDTPLPTPTFTPLPIIIDFSAVLNSSVRDVEKYLGKSSEVLPIKTAEFPELPDGGESRTYYLDDFTIYVFYDKQKVAREMYMFGLEKYGYKMDEWPTLMSRLGFPIDNPPDRVAPAGRHWENYNGYGISLEANKLDGPIDFAKIFKLP